MWRREMDAGAALRLKGFHVFNGKKWVVWLGNELKTGGYKKINWWSVFRFHWARPSAKKPTILAGLFCWKTLQRGQGHGGYKHWMRLFPLPNNLSRSSWSTLSGQPGGCLHFPWLNCTCFAAEQRTLLSRFIAFILLIRILVKTERCCCLERTLIIKLRYSGEHTP